MNKNIVGHRYKSAFGRECFCFIETGQETALLLDKFHGDLMIEMSYTQDFLGKDNFRRQESQI